MAVSMEAIKELKEKTGAGMLDCKLALQEANGDLERAVDFLRKKGIAKAAKKEGRAAKEGKITFQVADDGSKAILTKINCETDFVAKTDEFDSFCKMVTDMIFSKGYRFGGALPDDVETARKEIVGKLGENILVSEWQTIEAKGVLYPYVHLNKVGTVVDFEIEKSNVSDEETQRLMKNIAMQITAMNPLSVSREDIPQQEEAREREIFLDQARQTGKPEKVIEKIVEGKMKKFYEENVLLEQRFILDGEKTVQDLLDDFYKAKGFRITVQNFIRMAL